VHLFADASCNPLPCGHVPRPQVLKETGEHPLAIAAKAYQGVMQHPVFKGPDFFACVCLSQMNASGTAAHQPLSVAQEVNGRDRVARAWTLQHVEFVACFGIPEQEGSVIPEVAGGGGKPFSIR